MYKKRDKFKRVMGIEGEIKRTYEGVLYDSEMEMKFYRDYLLPKRATGEIMVIIQQPKFVLQDGFEKHGKNILPINYIGDFEVIFKDGTSIVYDVKGLPTETARIKKKMFDFRYRGKTLIWIALSVKYGGWIEYDALQKKRTKDKKAKNI